jgi:hypothetical protein
MHKEPRTKVSLTYNICYCAEKGGSTIFEMPMNSASSLDDATDELNRHANLFTRYYGAVKELFTREEEETTNSLGCRMIVPRGTPLPFDSVALRIRCVRVSYESY